MRFLVTGGAGFIGSHLVEKLISTNHVDIVDNFNDYYNPAIKRENIKKVLSSDHVKLYEGDILDYNFLESIFKQNQYDYIVHLAARAGVRPSIQEPLLYEKVNIQGTMHLLELCKQYHTDKFIFASSSSVYGANKKVPFHEDDSVDFPVSPYAATKKAGELVCYTYHKLYNISITCLRFFTVYGPRQRPDMAIHKFTRLIYEDKSVPVFSNGKSKRDYTYIDDIIQGILASIENCNGYHIYNLGESKTVQLMYLLELLQKGLGKKAQLEFLPDQPGDVPVTFADVSRAKAELNYNPQIAIEEGINSFIEWFLDNNNTVKR
ncbi:GDP-mannose 4,6-dehydratase [candidate division KSB1 bacterium]|nr:GDP-mannose 4,6-dehydratase [candidate division KSB1 bacterium]